MDVAQPSLQIIERVASLVGSKPAAWGPIVGSGYTPAERWVATLSDGSTLFAKVATTEDTATWLRDEYRVYARVVEAFLPRLLGWDDDGTAPILLLEDLSGGEWPPPWSGERVGRVTRMLEHVWGAVAPEGLPRLEDGRDRLASWTEVRDDPDTFVALGLCSAAWLEQALPELIEAERSAVLEGDELVHLDVRSDNICFLGDRTLLVAGGVALGRAGARAAAARRRGSASVERAQPARSHTEMCCWLEDSKGRRSHPLHRSRSRRPASLAIRSSSDG